MERCYILTIRGYCDTVLIYLMDAAILIVGEISLVRRHAVDRHSRTGQPVQIIVSVGLHRTQDIILDLKDIADVVEIIVQVLEILSVYPVQQELLTIIGIVSDHAVGKLFSGDLVPCIVVQVVHNTLNTIQQSLSVVGKANAGSVRIGDLRSLSMLSYS